MKENLSSSELLEVEPLTTIYLSLTLTQELKDSGISFIQLDSIHPCSVFLDQKLLYTCNPEIDQAINQIQFTEGYKGINKINESNRFTLPYDFVGKPLTIATTHPSSDYISLPGIIASSEAIDAQSWMSSANNIFHCSLVTLRSSNWSNLV